MIRKLDLGYMPTQNEEDATSTKQVPPLPASSPSPSSSTPSSTSSDASDSTSSTLSLQPNIPKDFDLFLNLVDFCKSILPTTCPEFFTRWIYVSEQERRFGQKMILTNQDIWKRNHYKIQQVSPGEWVLQAA